MTIDWINFTPWSALGGGMLIGVAIAILLLSLGRIAGISGIVSGLLHPRRKDTAWRAAFVLGLIVAPMLDQALAYLPAPTIDTGWTVLVVAGLLVGFGTRTGAGCTSGHGVCGMSRLSPRSMVATLTFMGAGFVTVYVLRHLLG
jgi:uncharacterized protein